MFLVKINRPTDLLELGLYTYIIYDHMNDLVEQIVNSIIIVIPQAFITTILASQVFVSTLLLRFLNLLLQTADLFFGNVIIWLRFFISAMFYFFYLLKINSVLSSYHHHSSYHSRLIYRPINDGKVSSLQPKYICNNFLLMSRTAISP